MATKIVDSYQFIGTCATGSRALTNWSGPHSNVAFYAAGNTGSQVPVSAFDLGDSIAAVPTDVLNTGSAFGSDELDLTSWFASMPAGATSLLRHPCTARRMPPCSTGTAIRPRRATAPTPSRSTPRP